jgi:FtsH-binding integral membrane protein
MFNDQLIQPTDKPSTSSSNPSIVDDFMYGSNVAQSHLTIRLGFMRKVYGILSVQLAFTTLIGVIIMSSEALQDFIKTKFEF